MNELDKVPAEADDQNRETVATTATENYHAMTRRQLADALKGIVEAGDMELHREVAAIKQAYYTLVNRESVAELAAFVEAGNDPAAFSAPADPIEVELKELLSLFRERRQAYLEEREAERTRNLEAKNGIIAKIKALVDDIDNINMRFSDFQQLQADFKETGPVPAGAENEVWKNYQLAVEQFYDMLKMNKELRDLDFKKNLAIKQDLLEKARGLAEMEDPIEAFRQLQQLHDQWRETGPVAREIREEIWSDFKAASTVVNKRHQDHFQARKEEEGANEARKEELCAKVEAIDLTAIKSYSEWDAKTKEVIELQKEYKETGFASRKSNNALFGRFRKACDAFFAAKAEYYQKTRDEYKANAERKEALCVKAEALVDKALDKGALDSMQALQAEWRTVGTVPRKQGDDLWKRFCAAADAFHASRRKHYGAQRQVEMENLKAKQTIVAALKEIATDSDRSQVIGRIRELQEQWQQTGFVPFKHKEAIYNEYRAELDRLFGAFGAKEKGQRMRRFEGELKKMEGDGKSMGRERDRLMRAIEGRESEIKTIENNMGFFKFAKSGSNPMLKDFERKISKLRDEISQLKEKVALLDSVDAKEGKEPKK